MEEEYLKLKEIEEYHRKENGKLREENNILRKENEILLKQVHSYQDYFGNPPCYDDSKYIHKNVVLKLIEEVKDRKVEDMFITATQGKLNTIIDLERLLNETED